MEMVLTQALPVSLSKSDLIKRLKSVQEALKNTDQEETGGEPSHLDRLSASLIKPQLLSHKDKVPLFYYKFYTFMLLIFKDVRLLVANCIVDVLRLYAPTPPYTSDQLKVNDFGNSLMLMLSDSCSLCVSYSTNN